MCLGCTHLHKPQSLGEAVIDPRFDLDFSSPHQVRDQISQDNHSGCGKHPPRKSHTSKVGNRSVRAPQATRRVSTSW